MKYLVIASKQDKAGINITTQLSQFKNPNITFYLVEGETVYDKNIDKEKINKFDVIIFASKHQSKKQEKTLSIHAPGNWRQADFGGAPGMVSMTSSQLQKQMFQTLEKTTKKLNLKNYQVTLECTHHGPLINKPCVFIEIGATPTEWQDRKAGFVVATTIHETIQNFKENPYNENAIGIGGPHYCPNFNKIQLNSNIALSHIIPLYQLPLKKEMLNEAFRKTKEEIDFILLDWKGIGNSEQRKQILEIIDSSYLTYKKTSQIKNK